MRKWTPSQELEIKRLHHRDIEEWEPAKVVGKINGEFCKFKNGEAVLVKKEQGGKTYTVTRARWRGSMVPLAHSMIRVPKASLTIL